MKYLKHSIENLLNNVVEHRTSPRISTFTVLNLFCLHIAEQRPLEGSPAVVTILRERFCFMLCPDPPGFLQSHLVGRKKCRGWMSLRLTDAPARKWTEAAFFGWKTAKAGSSWPSICQRKQFCWCTLLLKGRGVFKLKYSSVLRTIKNLTKTAHVFSNWQFSLSSKRQSLKTARRALVVLRLCIWLQLFAMGSCWKSEVGTSWKWKVGSLSASWKLGVEAAAARKWRNTGAFLSEFATFPLPRFNNIYLIRNPKERSWWSAKLNQSWWLRIGQQIGWVKRGHKYKYRYKYKYKYKYKYR